MEAHDLIHGGLYLIGDSQIVRFNALNGGFYTLDGDFIGNPFADAESGEIECFTINQNWLKISPIPLTPEILEKNGFELNEEDDWFECENNHCYVVVLFCRELYTDEIQNDSFTIFNGCDCRYVHQLQHALRLCGLTELADGFKV